MTARATKADVAMVPASFSISLERDPARAEALRILDSLGIDHRAHDSAIEVLRFDSWKAHLKGGGASQDRQRLLTRKHDLARVGGRIGGLERQGRDATEATAEHEAIKREISNLEERIQAAGSAADNDQTVRLLALQRAEHSLETVRGRLAPYRRMGGIRPPEELERQEQECERALNVARDHFEAGRVELEVIAERVKAGTEKVLVALREAIGQACMRLGRDCLGAVPEADRSFVQRYPSRLSDECERLYRMAAHLDDLGSRLGGRRGAALAVFLAACGALARPIQIKVTGYAPPERPEKGETIGAAL